MITGAAKVQISLCLCSQIRICSVCLSYQVIQVQQTGTVAQLVAHQALCDREVAGSIPGQVIPKTLKMVLVALSFGTQH